MRVGKVDWSQANKAVVKETRRRALRAAEVIKDEVKKNCPVGSVERPMYVTGKYAGQAFTKRDGGSLKNTIRVVEKDDYGFSGTVVEDLGGVRVYAGDYYAYYAAIVEFFTPYIRPSVENTKQRVADILEGKE